jgi:hypothetical protein
LLYCRNAEHAQKKLVEKLEQKVSDAQKKMVTTREEIEKEKVILKKIVHLIEM